MRAMPAGDGQSAVAPAPRVLRRLLFLAAAAFGFWLLGAMLGAHHASAAPFAHPQRQVVTPDVRKVVDSGRAAVRQPLQAVATVRPVRQTVNEVRTTLTRTAQDTAHDVSARVHAVTGHRSPVGAITLPVAVTPQPAQHTAAPTATAKSAIRVQHHRAPLATPRPVVRLALLARPSTALSHYATAVPHLVAHADAHPSRPGDPGPAPSPQLVGGTSPSSADDGAGTAFSAVDVSRWLDRGRSPTAARLVELTTAARAAELPEPSVWPG